MPPVTENLESKRFRISSIAFGNQTVSMKTKFETHGFASTPRGEFAFIVQSFTLTKNLSGRSPERRASCTFRIKLCINVFVNRDFDLLEVVIVKEVGFCMNRARAN
jgi:hypothetical protein